MYKNVKKMAIALFMGCLFFNSLTAQDGEALFKPCTICHTIGGGKLVGPDLKGVLDRRPEAEILKYVKNPAAYGVTLMPPQDLNDSEILAILAYIYDIAPVDEVVEEVELIFEEDEVAVDFSASDYEKHNADNAVVELTDDVLAGAMLFEGSTVFKNGGASCISCHNVSDGNTMQGGLLAKDLTGAFSRIGGERGIGGIVTGLPFPAMKAAYGDHPITEDELVLIQAYLKYADSNVANGANSVSQASFFFSGVAGLGVILLLIFFIWFKRKKGGVKDDIYNRQVKSI